MAQFSPSSPTLKVTIIRKDRDDEFNAIIEAGYFRTTSIKCWVALGIYLFVSPITVTYHDKTCCVFASRK